MRHDPKVLRSVGKFLPLFALGACLLGTLPVLAQNSHPVRPAPVVGFGRTPLVLHPCYRTEGISPEECEQLDMPRERQDPSEITAEFLSRFDKWVFGERFQSIPIHVSKANVIVSLTADQGFTREIWKNLISDLLFNSPHFLPNIDFDFYANKKAADLRIHFTSSLSKEPNDIPAPPGTEITLKTSAVNPRFSVPTPRQLEAAASMINTDSQEVHASNSHCTMKKKIEGGLTIQTNSLIIFSLRTLPSGTTILSDETAACYAATLYFHLGFSNVPHLPMKEFSSGPLPDNRLVPAFYAKAIMNMMYSGRTLPGMTRDEVLKSLSK